MLLLSTFSKVLTEVLDVLEEKLCPRWIVLEMNVDEKRSTKLDFFQSGGIPGVIGCIDGIHIRVQTPSLGIRHLYCNRKGFYSLNAKIICGNKMKIRAVNTKFPGAQHNSHVWNASFARSYFGMNFTNGDKNSHLLGDAGYPLELWLLTPYRTPQSSSP